MQRQRSGGTRKVDTEGEQLRLLVHLHDFFPPLYVEHSQAESLGWVRSPLRNA
jgi:hypothetical protein